MTLEDGVIDALLIICTVTGERGNETVDPRHATERVCAARRPGCVRDHLAARSSSRLRRRSAARSALRQTRRSLGEAGVMMEAMFLTADLLEDVIVGASTRADGSSLPSVVGISAHGGSLD